MIRYYPIEHALGEIELLLINGHTLHESMSRYNIFDKKLVAMTKVGEESSRLGEVFSKLHTRYSDELEYNIKVLNNLLEPVLIIIVGGIVATILVAMYLPMFQISTSIH